MSTRRVAALLSGVLVLYLAFVGWRGIVLIRDGRLPFVLLGVGVVLLPLVGLWVVVAEWRFGRATERLARDLEAEAGLPVDDLPRTPGGRIERAAADAVFLQRRAEVDAAPGDWRGWYRLAVAYGDAGDTKRGRAAMRQAIKLHAGAAVGGLPPS